MPCIKLVEQFVKIAIWHVLRQGRTFQAGRGVIGGPIILKSIASKKVDFTEKTRV